LGHERESGISSLKFQISNWLGQNWQHCISDFLSADCLHTAKIYWTLAAKTWATFDVVSQDNVTVAERPGQTRLSGTKNGDHRYAKQCSEVHRAGIVGKQQTASSHLVDKFIKRCLADPIHATIPDRSRDLVPY
jgi:creatinine amidohydrolase/Fe(II)-dependent formamide hydrolase-like protein